jgi:hypothetical protein
MYGVFVVASQEVRGAVARLRFMLLNAALAAAAIAIVAATVVLYYLIRFGSAPSLDSYLHSVRAFSGGVGALPMPPFGAWGLPCLAYAISIFVALRVLWMNPDRCERRGAAALLALAAGGIVWFRYYQVRSSPEQLQLAAFPALCCGALLVDRPLAHARSPAMGDGSRVGGDRSAARCRVQRMVVEPVFRPAIVDVHRARVAP